MKISERLKKSRKRAYIARFLLLVSILYLSMIIIKTISFYSQETELFKNIHALMSQIINSTMNYGGSYLWDFIPILDFPTGLRLSIDDLFDFYKTLIIPIIFIGICTFFNQDYSNIKSEYISLKNQIKNEKDLRELRKANGLEKLSDKDTIELVISNTNSELTAWHNTWWGKIVIGIAIAAIVVKLGMR